MKKNTKKKVLFISSTGGHLNELLQLSPLFEKYDFYHMGQEQNYFLIYLNIYIYVLKQYITILN